MQSGSGGQGLASARERSDIDAGMPRASDAISAATAAVGGNNATKESRQMCVPTKSITASGIIGLAAPTVSEALVPVAMSTFGVVTNGVGTIHAPGGAAAILQYISTCGTIASGSAVLLPTAVLSFLYYNKDVIRAKIQAKL